MKDLKKADFAETAIEFGKYVQQQWVVVRSFQSQVNQDATENADYFSFVNGQKLITLGSTNNELRVSFSDASGNGASLTLSGSDTSNYHIAVPKLSSTEIKHEGDKKIEIKLEDGATLEDIKRQLKEIEQDSASDIDFEEINE